MKLFDASHAARTAARPSAERPATAVVHDTDDARVVVFNLAPGQAVPPHTSKSTVQLTVLEGAGFLTGEDDGKTIERPCTAGEIAVYAPSELHGMRAGDEHLLILAMITPRPGTR